MTQQFITCPDCGLDLLVIPDLKAMREAIERHINEAHSSSSDFSKERLDERLIQKLFTQLIVRASEATTVEGTVHHFYPNDWCVTAEEDGCKNHVYIGDLLKNLEDKKVRITVEEL